MNKKVLVDTSIIIDYSRGNGEILLELVDLSQQGKIDLYTNSVVITEFFSGIELNNPTLYKQAFFLFESLFTCIDIGYEEALLAGKLRRKNKIPLTTDAIIASICIINNLSLLPQIKNTFPIFKT